MRMMRIDEGFGVKFKPERKEKINLRKENKFIVAFSPINYRRIAN